MQQEISSLCEVEDGSSVVLADTNVNEIFDLHVSVEERVQVIVLRDMDVLPVGHGRGRARGSIGETNASKVVQEDAVNELDVNEFLCCVHICMYKCVCGV